MYIICAHGFGTGEGGNTFANYAYKCFYKNERTLKYNLPSFHISLEG